MTPSDQPADPSAGVLPGVAAGAARGADLAPPVTIAAAERLDVRIARERGLSRSVAQALIAAGAVSCNGRTARSGQRVRPEVEVHVDEAAAAVGDGRRADVDEDAAVQLRVVLEDEWLAVIDKPAGLVVHPARGHRSGTLADGLRQRGDTWSVLGGGDRAGIVHRLDRFTSGLLVVAKTDAAHRALAAQLADHSLGRTYWALAWGAFTESTGEVDAPIGRDLRERTRMAVALGGREARTDFTVVERMARATLLDVALHTGRTHQIRVHLAAISHPLVGDDVYGRRDDRWAGRPALHARKLRFRHPADGHDVVVEAPLPPDLEALLARAREGSL